MEQSSVDIRAFVNSDLAGARINKIYKMSDHWLIDVFKGERVFIKISPSAIWYSKTKPQAPIPKGLVVQLRKYLEGKRIDSVEQLGWDRIVIFNIGEYKLIIELFSRGNVLLVKDGKIKGCAHMKKWKDRDVLPGRDYIAPPQGKNLLKMTFEEFKELKGKTSTVLIRELSLGSYGKEMLEGLSEKFEDISENDKRALFERIQNLIKNPPLREVAEDEAIPPVVHVNKELEALRVSLMTQKATIEKNKKKAKRARLGGNAIMANFNEVEALLRKARERIKTGEKMSKGTLNRASKTLEIELN